MKEQVTPVKILLADDHEMVRDGFRSFVNSQPALHFVGEAANGQQLVELAQVNMPDVIFTDIAMPVMDGIAATRALSSKLPKTKIIAFTMFNNHKSIAEMFDAGAMGYINKIAGKSEILDSIDTVMQNKYFYCTATDHQLTKMLAGTNINPKDPPIKIIFSQKEREIIKLICQQYFNKEISEALHVSIRTVEGHRERIMQKMNARNTVGLVIYAIRYGFYTPEGM